MKIERGVTYWGITGGREVERKVNVIEIRTSGKVYVNWTHKNKDWSDGKTSWTELSKFTDWVKGVYCND